MAANAVRLIEGAAHDGRNGLTQVRAVTREGSVFVVRDDRHVVAAVTGPEPTVGLVFYDLKTCLRMAAEDPAEKTPPKAAPEAESPEGPRDSTEPKRKRAAKKTEGDGA
jgi:hypothetical protein